MLREFNIRIPVIRRLRPSWPGARSSASRGVSSNSAKIYCSVLRVILPPEIGTLDSGAPEGSGFDRYRQGEGGHDAVDEVDAAGHVSAELKTGLFQVLCDQTEVEWVTLNIRK